LPGWSFCRDRLGSSWSWRRGGGGGGGTGLVGLAQTLVAVVEAAAVLAGGSCTSMPLDLALTREHNLCSHDWRWRYGWYGRQWRSW